jgi:sterol 3beta-glucosyltransferase
VRVVTHATFEAFVCGKGLDFAALGGDPSALVASMTEQVEPSRRWLWLPRRLAGARDSMRAGRGMSAAVMRDIPEMTENSWKASQAADALLLSTFAAFTTGIPIGRKLGIPAFVAHPFPLTPTATFSPVGLAATPHWPAALRPRYNWLSGKAAHWFITTMYSKYAQAAQRILGLPVLPLGEQLRALATPTLHGYSPSFLPPPADWPEQNRVTGYWFLDPGTDWQPPAALRDFLDAGLSPVYIGFGSTIRRSPQELTDMVITAVRRSRQRAILMTGAALTAGPASDDVFTLESVPHDWLFPRMAAVVHHGGAGTTGAGLRAGKPTVIVRFTADQPFWGQRVYERGVGPKPIAQHHLSAQNLAEAIYTAVSDPHIHANAEAMGEKIRAEDGVGAAVAIISQTLARSSRPATQGCRPGVT